MGRNMKDEVMQLLLKLLLVGATILFFLSPPPAYSFVPEPKGLCYNKIYHEYQKPPCPIIRQYYSAEQQKWVEDLPNEHHLDCFLVSHQIYMDCMKGVGRAARLLGGVGGYNGAVLENELLGDLSSCFDQNQRDLKLCKAACKNAIGPRAGPLDCN